jgi:hypothetical protein
VEKAELKDTSPKKLRPSSVQIDDVEDEAIACEKHMESITDSAVLLERIGDEPEPILKHRDRRFKKPYVPSSTKVEPAKTRRKAPMIEEIEDVDDRINASRRHIK